MSNRKKRVYNSATRQAQAAQTKNRILAAAKDLFQAEGFECVTIEKIAQASQVAVPTVYALFQSKRGVLRVLMDEALPPDEFHALVEKFKEETSVQKRFAITAQLARCLYDAERAQMEILRGAAVLTPEFKELEKEREQRRHQRLKAGIQVLAKEKALAKGLKPAKALDILWTLTGRDLYRMLVAERGWTSQAYETWLGQSLIKLLT